MASDKLGKRFLSLKFLCSEINSANEVGIDRDDQSTGFSVASLTTAKAQFPKSNL